MSVNWDSVRDKGDKLGLCDGQKGLNRGLQGPVGVNDGCVMASGDLIKAV